MRTRESAIEREFVRQAPSGHLIEVLATQVKLPIGRLDVLGKWHHQLAVFEVKSAAAGGDAVSQVMSYAGQVSRILDLGSAGVFGIIVAPKLKGEAVRAWRVGLCEFIRVSGPLGDLRFGEARRDRADDWACFDEGPWSRSKLLMDLRLRHYHDEAEEIALLISIHAQAGTAEDGGARVPAYCLEDMRQQGWVNAWDSLP